MKAKRKERKFPIKEWEKANLYGTNISETAPTMRIGIRAKHLSVLENEID